MGRWGGQATRGDVERVSRSWPACRGVGTGRAAGGQGRRAGSGRVCSSWNMAGRGRSSRSQLDSSVGRERRWNDVRGHCDLLVPQLLLRWSLIIPPVSPAPALPRLPVSTPHVNWPGAPCPWVRVCQGSQRMVQDELGVWASGISTLRNGGRRARWEDWTRVGPSRPSPQPPQVRVCQVYSRGGCGQPRRLRVIECSGHCRAHGRIDGCPLTSFLTCGSLVLCFRDVK